MNNFSRPILAANRVLDELFITQDDLRRYLDEIVRERGALVKYDHLDSSEARLNLAGKPAIITVSTSIKNYQRRRFNITHELGHLEMHRKVITVCTHDDIDTWHVQQSHKSHEIEASEFSAAFLMPERFFSDLCEEEPSIEYFTEIASIFDTSLTATSLRYTYFTPEPVAIVFSQDNFIKWFKASKEFEELGLFVDIRSRLNWDTRASRFFLGESISKNRKTVNLSSWCRQGQYSRDATIQEQSAAVSADTVLTLLWVNDDIDDIDD